ncbi:MAG: hypothetical protein ABEJ86_02865 [Halococcoides sp.]
MGTESDPPVEVEYEVDDEERRLVYRSGGDSVTLAQNASGYAMIAVRFESRERERYYGFEMALDHAAELLGVAPDALPVPDAAADMGM